MTTTLRIRTTADLIEVAPMLMGYAPHEQAVVVAVAAGRIAVTAAVPLAQLEQAGEALVQPCRSAKADSATVIVYSQDPEAWTALVLDALDRLDLAGIAPSLLYATDRAYAEVDDRTGAVGGWVARTTTSVVTEAVVAGLPTPSLTREQRVAAITPQPQRCAAVLDTAPQEFNGIEVAETLRALATGTEAMTPQAVRALAAALMDRAAWGRWFDGLTREQATETLPVWCEVATHYADEVSTARTEYEGERVLIALGFAAWLAGDGTFLLTALERLAARGRAGLLADPAVELEGVMIRVAHELAVPPTRWLRGGDDAQA